MSDFADLCLAPPRAAGRPQRRVVSAPLSPNASNNALSPSVGIINSVLIGSLFWIGVLTVITLV